VCDSSNQSMKRASRAGHSARSKSILFVVCALVAACGRSPAASEENAGVVASGAQPVLAAGGASAEPKPASAASAPPLTAPSSDSPSALTACASLCKKSKALHCPKLAECETQCLAMYQLRPCLAQVGKFVACLQREPIEHWECDEDGAAAIRDGYCNKEQAAIVDCGNEPTH
jgi:hypothetical protein